jgi:hypothetical protein
MISSRISSDGTIFLRAGVERPRKRPRHDSPLCLEDGFSDNPERGPLRDRENDNDNNNNNNNNNNDSDSDSDNDNESDNHNGDGNDECGCDAPVPDGLDQYYLEMHSRSPIEQGENVPGEHTLTISCARSQDPSDLTTQNCSVGQICVDPIFTSTPLKANAMTPAALMRQRDLGAAKLFESMVEVWTNRPLQFLASQEEIGTIENISCAKRLRNMWDKASNQMTHCRMI